MIDDALQILQQAAVENAEIRFREAMQVWRAAIKRRTEHLEAFPDSESLDHSILVARADAIHAQAILNKELNRNDIVC